MPTPKWPTAKTEKTTWQPQFGDPKKIPTAVLPAIGSAAVKLDMETIVSSEIALREVTRLDEFSRLTFPSGTRTLMAFVEALWSSKIEGLHPSTTDLAIEFADHSEAFAADIVKGNIDVTIAASEHTAPITAKVLHGWHRILLPFDPRAGQARESIVWIGGGWLGPQNAKFVPPRADRIESNLDDLTIFTERADLPTLVHAALAHAQFEAIHPYHDGNGRTGRAMIQSMLASAGFTTSTVVPLSAFLYHRRADYYDALGDFRDGDIEPIVSLFIATIESAAWWGHKVTDLLSRTRDEMRLMNPSRGDSAASKLIEHLFVSPAVTVSSAAAAIGVSVAAARQAIETLENVGVLTESTGRKRGKVWVSDYILGALGTSLNG